MKLLKKSRNWFNNILFYFNHFFEILSGKYSRALKWSLLHRKTIVFGSIAIFLLSFLLMGLLGTQFFPETDQNQFTVTVKAAPGSSLEQTSNICSLVEDQLRKRKEVETILTTIGSGNDPVTNANILAKLVHKKYRKFSDKEIITQLRSQLQKIPGAEIGFLTVGGPGGNDKPISISVRGDDQNKLTVLADKVENIVKLTKGTVDIGNSLELSKPEVRLKIDREKASDLGINPLVLASAVRSLVDGYVATQFQEGDDQVDVRVRLKKDNRTNLNDLSMLTIKSNKKINNQDFLVPLSDVADITQGLGPSQIKRYSRQKEIRVSANLSGALLGNVLRDITKETSKLELEPGYSINIVGQGQMQEEAFTNMILTMILAILFVYIVLAAQFDSFVHPFSIMLALPMSIIGAVIFLLFFGSAMSVIAVIGIIMLMGLVTKNGILLVDYTNVLRERGMNRFDALLKAGPTRLRPILMTTFAMIFGMIPVALGLGEGAEFRSPMGQAVIGGLVTSTLLTLFIVPVVYSILDDLGEKNVFRFLGRLFSKKKKETYLEK